METARILVFGNVQGVGFRAYAKQIARNMQIIGFARNLDDGSVEIYAQAPKPTISAFIKRITIRGNPSDPLSLHVAKTTIAFEHSKDFKKPGKKLKTFEIDYGKRLKIEAKEAIEKAEIATLIMHSLKSENNKNFKTLGSKINKNFKTLGSKINKNFKTLGSKTDSLTKTAAESFDKLDGKYGSISSTLNNIDNKLGSINCSIKSMSGGVKQNNKLLSKIAGKFAAV
ncbi:MAG: acylphosphatase [Candidatus Diapherotrites archaeon]|uniref:acylphosphatase n=1 Tax=Candidatus Iainarchaeum sp. TaxID=3101447 RepID=A0A8T4KRH3_9ARCH|nr:acylphosphatase [Candidatus Diapherotrites archaeon]